MRISKALIAAGAAVVGLMWTGSTKAGTLEIALQEDGGTITVVGTAADFTSVSYGSPTAATFGDFLVKIFRGSSDNTAHLSDLLSSTTDVLNTSSSSHTLTLYVTQANYTLPVGTLLTVRSSMGANMTNPGDIPVAGATFQAYENNSNGTFDTTGASTNGLQTAIVINPPPLQLGTGTATGSFARTTSTSLFSVTGVTTIVLNGNGQANFSDQIDLTAVPLPATASTGLALLGGLGVLGGVNVLRRRRQMA